MLRLARLLQLRQLGLRPLTTRRQHLALLLRTPDLAALVVVKLVVLAAHVSKYVAHAAATAVAHERRHLVHADRAIYRSAPLLCHGWPSPGMLWASSCGHHGGERRWGDKRWVQAVCGWWRLSRRLLLSRQGIREQPTEGGGCRRLKIAWRSAELHVCEGQHAKRDHAE